MNYINSFFENDSAVFVTGIILFFITLIVFIKLRNEKKILLKQKEQYEKAQAQAQLDRILS